MASRGTFDTTISNWRSNHHIDLSSQARRTPTDAADRLFKDLAVQIMAVHRVISLLTEGMVVPEVALAAAEVVAQSLAGHTLRWSICSKRFQ